MPGKGPIFYFHKGFAILWKGYSSTLAYFLTLSKPAIGPVRSLLIVLHVRHSSLFPTATTVPGTPEIGEWAGRCKQASLVLREGRPPLERLRAWSPLKKFLGWS